jgi:hypothetical protein
MCPKCIIRKINNNYFFTPKYSFILKNQIKDLEDENIRITN